MAHNKKQEEAHLANIPVTDAFVYDSTSLMFRQRKSKALTEWNSA